VGKPVFARKDLFEPGAGLDHPGPADDGRDAPAAFPFGVLFAAERGDPCIGEETDHRAVVGGVDDDGVPGQAEIVHGLEQLANQRVVLDHSVDIETRNSNRR
jgi:hypothetical protein